MFSGIVAETGIVTSRKKINEGFLFRVKGNKTVKNMKASDSIAVNGVCHTVTKRYGNEFEFITMHETLKKTGLCSLVKGSKVNLENPLRLGGEIGGHFVSGHVDDTGIITDIKQIRSINKKESDNYEVRIRINKKYRKYLIHVGSIAIDGVSLTVADISPIKGKYFVIMVAIIPYTYKHTVFHNYTNGDKVNLEFDYLGKYILNFIEQQKPTSQRK